MPKNAKILLDRCVVKSSDKTQSDEYVTYDFFLLEPKGRSLERNDYLSFNREIVVYFFRGNWSICH